MKPNIRTLKVYSRFNDAKFSKNQLIPEIRLKGIWLKDRGFDCGKEIRVIKTKMGIIITNTENTTPTIVL